MKEEILKLIRLQAIDSEIAGFDHTIAKHQAGIASREQAIAEKQEAITQFRTKIELLNQKQAETKAEHDDAGARVKDRQNKMMQVQTSREHQALLKEIEENKRLVKETEDRILQFIEQIEQLEQEVAALENLCAGEQQLLAEEVENVDKEIQRIEEAKKSVLGRREAESAALQGPHLKRYTMLLAKRDGLAVVAVNGSVCQGCYMALPPQQVIEVRKAEKFNLCPTCQRILYYKEDEEVQVES
ncbi:zinc ribbon domain-containing protein [Desulfobulbus elongatus]|uniref:zinc ribbon domain-containing protein n=1 Tax=Desulfobulbus elongatus TaxID=53332 RepID=UPI000487FBC0|nr:C4-type zinc ribbon domain-containing protein [Desulfobulbus elongatus]